jgi:hypothetical protein
MCCGVITVARKGTDIRLTLDALRYQLQRMRTMHAKVKLDVGVLKQRNKTLDIRIGKLEQRLAERTP